MARYVLKVRNEFRGNKDLRQELAGISGVTYVDDASDIGLALIEADTAAIAEVRARADEWLIVEREKFIPAPGGHIPPPGF